MVVSTRWNQAGQEVLMLKTFYAVGPAVLVFPDSVVAAVGAGLQNRTKAHIQITGLQGFSAFAATMAAVNAKTI
jgi:hypothetical protein